MTRGEAFVATLAGPAGVDDPYRALSSLLPAPPGRARRAFLAAGYDLDDPTADEAAEVVREVIAARAPSPYTADMAAATVDLVLAVLAADADDPDGPGDDKEGLLLIDPEIAGLPLLDIAADWAAIVLHPRCLSVRVADLVDGLNGLYNPNAETVLISRRILNTPRLVVTWAHELAHVFDPDLGVVSPSGQESFAEHLGHLFLEHNPHSLKDAWALVEQAERACAQLRRHLPSEGDLDALVDFAVTSTKGTPA